jgi:hypothetical protein
MHICTQRERLIQALTKVGGVVEKRQTLPILGNIHIHADDDVLTFTGTDREAGDSDASRRQRHRIWGDYGSGKKVYRYLQGCSR